MISFLQKKILHVLKNWNVVEIYAIEKSHNNYDII